MLALMLHVAYIDRLTHRSDVGTRTTLIGVDMVDIRMEVDRGNSNSINDEVERSEVKTDNGTNNGILQAR